ncbi:MAG: ABC transporter ATP-binding protein [Gammaproteobacteria bacterium]|nr:MAG: ABC transporter ATP-binding protein [Gammaproteobacteria bacterium]
MTVLAVDRLGCALQGVPILQGISTRVGAGELVALVGPNGAGKSTLLRAMAGIQPGVQGQVQLDGRAVSGMGMRELAAARGYLAQASDAAWPVTVRYLVGLGRLPLRAFWQPATAGDAAAVERSMQQTDVHYLADRLVTTLSGGERLRAMLARVLAAEPLLILADEPLAALDPRHQLQTMQLLRAHCDAGGSAVVALHDLTLACRFCDRLLLLECGHAVIDDTPAVVMASGELERVYRVGFEPVSVDGRASVLPASVR